MATLIDAMQLTKSEKRLSEFITELLRYRSNVTTLGVIDSFASTKLRMFVLAKNLKYSQTAAEEMLELAAACVCFHARTMQELEQNLS